MVYKALFTLGMRLWDLVQLYPSGFTSVLASLATIVLTVIFIKIVNARNEMRETFHFEDTYRMLEYEQAVRRAEAEDRDQSTSNTSREDLENDVATPDSKDTHGRKCDQIPYKWRVKYGEQEMVRRSEFFYNYMNQRRSVRMFKNKDVPRSIIENILKAAGTSPSGAHQQPWTFVAVMEDQELKTEIKGVIENEERLNYERRMGPTWVDALQVLATEWQKPYLDIVPCLLFVFVQTYGVNEDGSRRPHYYQQLSTSIAVGILLAAIHHAGLVTVTSTPLNAGPAIHHLLKRPANEKLLLMLPIGYAADNVTVPKLERKSLNEFAVFL